MRWAGGGNSHRVRDWCLWEDGIGVAAKLAVGTAIWEGSMSGLKEHPSASFDAGGLSENELPY